MTRVAQSEILCVFAPLAWRSRIERELARLHPDAVRTPHPTGWWVVESPLGNPRSRFLGSNSDVRFLLGEEALAGDPSDNTRIEALKALVASDPAAIAALPGDFSFVVLRPHGCVSATRSCSGNPRVFGFFHQGITAVSTRLDWLAPMYPQELRFDRMRLAIDLCGLGVAPHFSSVLRGIEAVPCGHVAHWGKWQAPQISRYWSLPTRIEYRNASDIAQAIEKELGAELRRHIDSTTETAVLLSGGLDSSLLCGLVARETHLLGAVTTLPPKEHPDFAREQHFSRLAAKPCAEHSVFTFTPEALVAHLRTEPACLCPLGLEWLGVRGLQRHPEVLVSGWFADECWGFLRLSECLTPRLPNIVHLARHAPFKRELFRFWFNRRRSGRFTFPPANVAYPALLEPSLGAQFRGWLAQISWVPRPELAAEKLRLHRWLTDMGGLYAEAASYVGARAVTPFTSRALVELAARSDPHAFFRRGASKLPLRLIAQRVLPSALASRLDKGDWTPTTGRVPMPKPDVEAIEPLLDMSYLEDHSSLSLDDIWAIEWLNVLERGRLRAEHERKHIWG